MTYDTIIIGGGFAGLATSVKLASAGHKIALLEKRPFLGGRAYSFREPKTQSTVDNGQHLMMGCYHSTLEFLRIIGALPQLKFMERLEVTFRNTHRLAKLSCPNLPAPFHLLSGLLKFKNFSAQEKWRAIKMMLWVKLNRLPSDLDSMTVIDFLNQQGQSQHAIQEFWEPIVLATINEDIHIASSALFIEVLRRGLLASKKDSQLIISQVGLSKLYVEPALKFLNQYEAKVYTQCQMQSVERLANDWLVKDFNGNEYRGHHLVLAVPPTALKKIALPENLRINLEILKPSPILSINLWLKDWQAPEMFCGLLKSPLHWLFDKTQVLHEPAGPLSFVMSASHPMAKKTNQELVEMALEELHKIFPDSRNKALLHSQVIREFEATFANQTNCAHQRPTTQTILPHLYLAGDWTATGLPSTIESAVLSGFKASDAITRRTASF